MTTSRFTFRVHAVRRMFERGVSESDVRHVLATGERIEEYPGATPYPSYLVLGWCGARPLHVVAAEDAESNLTIVITVHEPNADRWEPGFRRRRTQ